MALPTNRNNQNRPLSQNPMQQRPQLPNVPVPNNPQNVTPQQGYPGQQFNQGQKFGQNPQQRQNIQQQGGYPGQQQGGGYPNRPVNPQQQQGQYGTQQRPEIPSNRPTLSNSPDRTPEGMVQMAAGYDYGGQAAKFTNAYDESDPFETLSIDEQLAEDGDPFEEIDVLNRPQRSTPKNTRAVDNRQKVDNRRNTEELTDEFNFGDIDDNDLFDDIEEQFSVKQKRASKSKQRKKASNRDRKVDDNDQDVFVDVEKIKIKPLGGKKKVRVDRYDDRKNRKQKAMIVQFGALALLAIILLVGLYNAIFPPKSLSEADVSAIIARDVGETTFPLEMGRGFVVDFMDAYLTINPDKTSSHKDVLGYFYTGNPDANSDTGSYMNSSTAIQTILYGPTVYQETEITDNTATYLSATYLVGAFVRQFEPESNLGEDKQGIKTYYVNGIKYETKDVVEKWLFFTVDVFYNPENNGISIALDSPTLVPNLNILPISEIPPANPIGDGEISEDLAAELSTIVIEFFKAYREASPNNYSGLEQYIDKNPPLSLKTGLNSEVEFNGAPENAITFIAAKSLTEGEFRAKVTVNWLSKINENSSISFDSVYFLSLKKDLTGKYVVTNVSAMPYIPDETGLEGSNITEDEYEDEEYIDDSEVEEEYESDEG